VLFRLFESGSHDEGGGGLRRDFGEAFSVGSAAVWTGESVGG
jgi:hypothetical protein